MNTDNLKHFVALSETGSYSEAAARSGVTQPAVTQAVRKLERDLGVRLVARSGNRYVPTPEGRILLDYSRRMLEAEAGLAAAIARRIEAASGHVRIATSNIPGEYVLPLVLGEFRAEHQDIEPVLEVLDSYKVVAAVGSGDFEFGLMGSHLEREDLVLTPFCPDTLRIICPPLHALAGKRTVKPGRLAGEKFVVREKGSGTGELMLEALSGAGLDTERLHVEMELGSTSAVISAVESGAGISMVSQWAARSPLADGRVGEIRVSGLKPTREFNIVRLKSYQPTAAADGLISFILGKRDSFRRYARDIAADSYASRETKYHIP